MTTTRVSVVQKPKYGILLLPVIWLVFSIWAVINSTFPQYEYEVQSSLPSDSQAFNLIIYALGALWVFFKILSNAKNRVAVSVELKSTFAFLLGATLMTANVYFHPSYFLFYAGMAVFDIAPILMIVTLLQGKPFAMLTLYRKDVQIQKGT